MATNHNTAGRPQGPFLKIGLSFGSAGAIVRLTAKDRIHSVIASWVRTRKGTTDKVFMTLPQQLIGPAEELVKCVVLQGDAQRSRFDFNIEPESRICTVLEGTESIASAEQARADGKDPDAEENKGCYAVVFMHRVGPIADFRSEMYYLDKRTWKPDTGSAQPIRNLRAWLHEDFLEQADGIASGWPIMYAASSLFGGQDQAEIDKMFEGVSVAPPQLPADLAMALDDEKRFRDSSRRARSLSAAQLEAFRKVLTTPEQAAAFEALLRGERTYA
jgi:hypothetical protein